MNVYLLDSQFNIIDIIDQYVSLIWTTRYFKRGDFELMVKASKKMVEKLQLGRYLVREKDIDGIAKKNVMVIQNIQIQTDVESGDNLIVSGYDLKDIVHRRVIPLQTMYIRDRIDEVVKALIDHNITFAETGRNIPTFSFRYTVGSDLVTIQVTGDNLGDYIEELLEKYGYGYEVSTSGIYMHFELRQGQDHSLGTSNPVIFSESFDNLLSTDYTVDTREYANVAYVGGEGEGSNRKIITTGSGTGIDRREIFVDARDISSNEGEISTENYNSMLATRGQEALTEHSTTTLFDGNVNNTVNYKLGVDYNLGDIVQVVTSYGISLPARITEIIESDDVNGSLILPTFSYEGGEE